MNNGIDRRQNTDSNIAHLAAMRQLYSESKLLFNIEFIFCVLIIIIANVLSIVGSKNPAMNTTVVVINFISIFVPFIAFNKWINNKKELAAKIQEEFDYNVLGINRNASQQGSRNSLLHEISVYKKKYERKNGIGWSDNLKDWYRVEYSQVPLNIGRLHCQFTNVNWDNELRSRFQKFLILSFCLCITILIIISACLDNSFIWSLEKIFLPFAPMLAFLYQTINSNKKTIDNLLNIKCQIANANAELNRAGIKEEELVELSNKLQAGIFEHRKEAFLIPDRIYARFRKMQEEETKDVASMVKEQHDSNN